MTGVHSHRFAELRARAAALLEGDHGQASVPGDPQAVIQELRVLHAELELQQEGFIESQQRAESTATHYAQLFREAPIAFVQLDHELQLEEVNTEARQALGLSDRPPRVPFVQFVAEDSVQAWNALLGRVAEEGAVGELTLRATGGRRLLARLTVARRTSREGTREFLVCMTDVTQLKEATTRARQANDRLVRLIADVRDGVVVVRWDTGLIEAANPAMARLLGASDEGLIGRPVRALFPAALAALQLVQLEQVFSLSSGQALDLQLLTNGQTVLETECSGGFLQEEHGRVLYLVVRDVGARHALERERRAFQDRTHQAQKLEAVGRLAAGVAHDFNNLLTAIIACLGEVHPHVPDAARPAFEDIGKAALRGRELAGSLLALSRETPARRTPMSLRQACDEAARLLRRALPANIGLTCTYGTTRDEIIGDEGQWVQVVLNAGLNARDAMPGGGRLTISTSATSDFTELAITDSGEGMADEVRERAFDPFFSTKAPGAGTGLGLAHARSVAEAHGAEVKLLSSPGRGTTLCFRFSNAREADPKRWLPPATATAPKLKGRVLLVDDDDLVRRGTERSLRRLGCVVTAVPGAEEALRHLAEPSNFDAMVSDLSMPGQSGEDLQRTLRARSVKTPVVILSGMIGEEQEHRLLANGVVAVVHKPYLEAELRQALLMTGTVVVSAAE